MMKANNDIRQLCRSKNIPLWRVALKIGISEPQFIRWMRVSLSEDRREQVLQAIDDLTREGEEAAALDQ